MARGSWTGNRHVVEGAYQALEKFKYDIANEIVPVPRLRGGGRSHGQADDPAG